MNDASTKRRLLIRRFNEKKGVDASTKKKYKNVVFALILKMKFGRVFFQKSKNIP